MHAKNQRKARIVMFISQFLTKIGSPFQGKEHSMKAGLIFVVAMTLGLCGCAGTHGQSSEKQESIEAGEVKVSVDQTPPAVRETIKRELVGAELEDIAQKQRDGKTVYETDIIKPGGQKWEVVIGEDGKTISKLQEGSAGDQAADKMDAQEAGWREA